MQKGKIFVFAGAVAAVFGGAYAGDDNAAALLLKKTVASKNYVDGSFQTKIPAVPLGLDGVVGDAGAVIAATDSDGVVSERLIIPGYRNPSPRSELAKAMNQQAIGDFWGVPVSDFADMLDDIYRQIVGGTGLPYDARYSIPSMELVLDLTQSLNDEISRLIIHESQIPLGVVLMPTDTAGATDYRFIIPGLDMTLDGANLPAYNVRNWSLFGGTMSNNELVEMLDDISRQFNNDRGWIDVGMNLNDVLYSPASLKLVSDVWNESQRTVPASGYAKAANGAGNAVAYTTGSGSAATDWLNAAVKGTGIVTKTSTAGQIGERKIIEESDVANYAGTALEKISVATMGAVAAYVDTHSPNIPAPTGDCLNAANHCALVTTYANGTISYSWTVMAK